MYLTDRNTAGGFLLRFAFANLQLRAALLAELCLFGYHSAALGAMPFQNGSGLFGGFFRFLHRFGGSLQLFDLLLQGFDVLIGTMLSQRAMT